MPPEVEPRLSIEPKVESPSEVGQVERQEDFVEKAEHQPQPVVDTSTGQSLLIPSTQEEDVEITLPLTEEEVKQGLHHKAMDAGRWLAEWCARAAKKAMVLGIKVVYRK